MSVPIFRIQWGNYFMRLYKTRPETEGQRNVRRQQEPASRKTTEVELARALNAIQDLRRTLEEMHRPAVMAIGGQSFFANTAFELSMLQIKLEHPQMPEFLNGDGKGRPVDPYPLEVAIEVGRFYRYITGRHPTIVKDPETGKAKGAFINVLTEVFGVLRITDASPEGRGAAAIKAIERMPEK